jgi:WD40 repeat protein
MTPLPIRFTISLILFCMLTACTATTPSKEVTALHAIDAPDPDITFLDQLSSPIRMNVPRAAHTATLLPNGQVLVAGGFREEGTREIAIGSAEIYDPKSGSFILTGDMNESRSGHTATLLPNGQVLIVGGWGTAQRTASAELYDPQTGKFSNTDSMSAPRAGMTTTALKDGRILIAGGDSARNTPQLMAEIFDPETAMFAPAGSLNEGRSTHTATLLVDGRVLLTGGSPGADQVLASAEIYEPATGKFTLTGSMGVVRYKHGAVLLHDGKVLVVGGSDQNDWTGKYTSTEVYDPAAGTFTKIAGLNDERFKLADALVLLSNRNVLVGGGNSQIEIYDVEKQQFTRTAQLDNHYYYAVLTLLHDGTVLITGGYDPDIQPTDQAWIYN